MANNNDNKVLNVPPLTFPGVQWRVENVYYRRTNYKSG